MIGQHFSHWRGRRRVLGLFFAEGRRLLDLAADDDADDKDQHAEQERNAPAPCQERLLGERVAQRQKDSGGENLAGLNALQGEAREIATPSEGGVLEDHGARAGDFARDRKSLDEAQDDEQNRRPHAGLRVGRHDADGHRRQAHEKQADEQDGSAAINIAIMSEDKSADRPRHVADAVSGERSDDRDGRIARRKEGLREDERSRRRIDEEIIIFERGADPSARRGHSCLTRACWLVRHG